eukprot:CAMPEP_0172833734 /NCGR_PEP_ID=MMETSP1075-20121228/24561_1 /TAXON_ID=2916 /ORGANISM="Ceratium fusus, Strain PA161109" /LENGTH=169 /DNA_ID=CAMNT_0013676525 /DNA_START=913 /DNA_END=1424 /DNA_ORIENTATION=+
MKLSKGTMVPIRPKHSLVAAAAAGAISGLPIAASAASAASAIASVCEFAAAPEHGSVAQMLRSDPEPRHGSPPCSGWRTTSRTRRIRPVSQLREHRDQSAQSPQMQSTGGQGAMPQRTVSESAPRSRGGLLQPRPGCLDLEATPPPQDVVHEDQSFQSCHLQPNVKPCT